MRSITTILLGIILFSTPEPVKTQHFEGLDEDSVRVLLIDVRPAVSFEEAHLEGAINIPFDTIAGKIDNIASSKDQEILLYCKSGIGAWIARIILKRKGYNNVTNLGKIQTLIDSGQYRKAAQFKP